MKKILSCEQIIQIDKNCIQSYGLPASSLIENAAQGLASFIINKYFDNSVLVVCGKGNNGADGYGVARLLKNAGFKKVVCYKAYENLNDECKLQRKIALNFKVEEIESLESFQCFDLIIDALYGTGFHSPLDEKGQTIISLINQHSNIISIDVPSGLSDSTALDSPSVDAKTIMSFGAMKTCLTTFVKTPPTVPLVFNPGFPLEELDKAQTSIFQIDFSDAKVKPFDFRAYKKTRGHCGFYQGSEKTCGASFLSSLSAFNTGAGLVSIYLRENEKRFFDYPQIMVENDLSKISKFSAFGLGPGVNEDDENAKRLLDSLLEKKVPLCVDAGCLGMLSRGSGGPLVLTPHIGELKRLLGLDLMKLSTLDFIKVVKDKAKELGATLVIKSSVTWIVNSQDIFVYFNNNPSLGVGGSGDVLCGIITAYLGMGYQATEAAINGVLTHSMAGVLAKKEKNFYDALVLIDHIGKAREKLEEIK